MAGATSESDSSLCSACEDLHLRRSDFERPPFEPEGRYCSVVLTDTLESLRTKRSSCPLCALFYDALVRNEAEKPELLLQAASNTKWEVQWMQSAFEYVPYGEASEDEFGSALFPRLDIPESHNNHGVQLVDDSQTEAFLRARMITATIEASRVTTWLRQCTDQHGPSCRPTVLEMPPHPSMLQNPFLVIDVQRGCLKELPEGDNYVALSYVWGDNNWPRTFVANLPKHRRADAFKSIMLPKTIADAVLFVQALNMQYLWVDSLCIVQDDPMKQTIINNMDAVYGHAYLTLVVASGANAQAGISGWSDNGPRSNTVLSKVVQPELRLGVIPFFDVEMMNSLHAQRAWTFQEGLLSLRWLVFLQGLVFFCCRAAVWREDINAELGDMVEPFEGANTLGRTLSTFPLRQFMQHISAYTYRKLTYSSDALDAFAGIQKALSRSMDNTKFWFGMPASVFDWALLFSGSLGQKMKRREGFPSWSWAGWQGYVNIGMDHYSEFDHEWLLYRTWVDWYIINESGNCVLVWEPIRYGTKKTELLLNHNEDVEDESEAVDANEDEASQQDTSEGTPELERCPQYGWPTDSSPYGRLADCIQSFKDCVNDAAKAPSPPFGGLKCGTLCFRTVSANYVLQPLAIRANDETHGKMNSRTSSVEYYTLADRAGNECGVIWNDGQYSGSSIISPREVQVLFLSHAAPGTTSSFDVLNLSWATSYGRAASEEKPDQQMILNDMHHWDYSNTMLVVPLSQFDPCAPVVHESRGIGLIHKKALDFALEPGASWKEIYLA